VLDDGSLWNNLVDPRKVKVAETLDEFRGAHLYPRNSAEVRALSAAVPIAYVWDDHEVRNNWFPGEIIESPAYSERRIDVLAPRARQAMFEYTPTLRRPAEPMYRTVSWGPLVDVFLLDARTYRTANEPAPEAGGLLGETQARWLVDALARSTAVWKVVACDMPIGIVVAEPGKKVAQANDGWANDDGPPREREVELARILAELRTRKVRNLVWVSADVHYAAAHRLDPARAAFKDFEPFWEFVAGPMHARGFPQHRPDDTFGTEVEWASATWTSFGSPAGGEQYFGLIRIDGASREMTVTFVNGRGQDVHQVRIPPS
jgi:alkaline phosphatase D